MEVKQSRQSIVLVLNHEDTNSWRSYATGADFNSSDICPSTTEAEQDGRLASVGGWYQLNAAAQHPCLSQSHRSPRPHHCPQQSSPGTIIGRGTTLPRITIVLHSQTDKIIDL